jgi:hypothetical protein
MGGTFWTRTHFCHVPSRRGEIEMNGIIYLIGLVVVIMAILSLLGLR